MKGYLFSNQQQQLLQAAVSSNNNTVIASNPNKTVAVSINIARNPITRGSDQAITVTGSDENSHEKVEGAKVSSQIINPLGLVRKKFEGTTNSIGQVSYLWMVGAGAMLGTFQVNAQLSAPGYENNSAQTTFVIQRR